MMAWNVECGLIMETVVGDCDDLHWLAKATLVTVVDGVHWSLCHVGGSMTGNIIVESQSEKRTTFRKRLNATE